MDKAIEAAARAIEDTGLLEGDEARSAAQAAIAASDAAREAEGFVWVPVEATPLMCEEGLLANDDALLMSADCNDMRNAYRAMIAARPKGEG